MIFTSSCRNIVHIEAEDPARRVSPLVFMVIGKKPTVKENVVYLLSYHSKGPLYLVKLVLLSLW